MIILDYSDLEPQVADIAVKIEKQTPPKSKWKHKVLEDLALIAVLALFSIFIVIVSSNHVANKFSSIADALQENDSVVQILQESDRGSYVPEIGLIG